MIVRILVFLTFFFHSLLYPQRVRVGAELLLEKHLHLLENKRIGVLCNHTSILPNRKHLVDSLLSLGVKITALFSPEHGIRGVIPRGVAINDSIDEKTGLKVYSLYGKQKMPTTHSMKEIDVFLVDLQDVGARFYTYYITMANAMEAASEHGKAFIVLDRPNPVNGIDIEGPLLDPVLQSGVGKFPIPIRHGMTIGELARMIVGEGWLSTTQHTAPLKLTVISMEGWHRTQWFDQTGLPWIPPSPNMKLLSTAIVYPGSCLIEGTNVSEGRGSFKPFEYIGAPWLDNKNLANKLNSLKLPGVRFHPIVFTPQSTPSSPAPKYQDKRCKGIFIQVQDRNAFRPVTSVLRIIKALHESQPHQFAIDSIFFDKLLGTSRFREALLSSALDDSLLTTLTSDIDPFLRVRAKYLLY